MVKFGGELDKLMKVWRLRGQAHFEGVFEDVDHGQKSPFLNVYVLIVEKVTKVVDHFEDDLLVLFAAK